jgi:ion channel POLLUX/CASTOR
VETRSVGERLRYAFDNYMARGTIALILGLFALSVLIIVSISLLVIVLGLAEPIEDDQAPPFIRTVWNALMRTLDAGTMGGDVGSPLFLLAMLAVTLGGIFIVATLIGVLSTGLEGKLEELRKGRSRVIERGHIVILGWSQQVFPILEELIAANSNQKRSVIVVLADEDKVLMEDAIRERIANMKRTRVVCRRGSPIDLDDIDIASVQTSRSIIVLAPENDDPDSDVIKTLLAITNDPDRRKEPYHVVAEIRDERNLEVARMVGRDEVELVLTGELIARITAQACRQSGLSVVYTELLDFGGDEIYFARTPELVGRTFGDVLGAFEESTVIGIRPAGRSPVVDPPMETVLGPEDELIVISEDDDTIRVRQPGGDGEVEEAAIRPAEPRPELPERTLVLGWNWKAPAIIRELDHYVAPGSALHVVADVPEAAALLEQVARDGRNQSVTFRIGDTTDRRVLDALDVTSFQHVIILCYSEHLDPQRADARTLVTLLHLRDIASRTGHVFSITSEMLDMRNRALAEVTRADDFIVSGRLVSLLMSQIAENKALNGVFRDIFDADGAEIYLRPASDYVDLGRPVSFYTVVEAARRRGEVALGYRIRPGTGPLPAASDDGASAGPVAGVSAVPPTGVVVNPRKSRAVVFDANDRVIVLADS